MAETKHTPGPWTWTDKKPGWHGWEVWDLDPTANVEACTVAQEVRSEADARLIAAAPDLLDALRALYTFPGVRDLLAPSGSLGSIRDEVEAAIAKAEGR